MTGDKQAIPCSDCDGDICIMNCGPSVSPGTPLEQRARNAIAALRKPDASLARVPSTVRTSIAEVIEHLLARA